MFAEIRFSLDFITCNATALWQNFFFNECFKIKKNRIENHIKI